MTEKITDEERVIRLLRARGEQGVTMTEFLAPHVVDGGKPITRMAARVGDLRHKRGHEIRTESVKSGEALVARYVLVHDACPPAPLKVVADLEVADTLFADVDRMAA